MSIYFVDTESDDKVECGSSSDFDNVFSGGGTAMARFYALNYGDGGFGRILDKANNNGADYGWALHLTDTTDSIQFVVGFRYWVIIWLPSHGRWDLGTDFMDGKFNAWHHVAVTYDSDDEDNLPLIYFDGVSQSITQRENPITEYRDDSSYDLSIGNSDDDDRQMWGNEEDARLYNRILSANEILTIANSYGTDGIVDGMVARYLMKAGSQGANISDPTTLQDVGINAHDGSIVDVPQWESGLLKRRRVA